VSTPVRPRRPNLRAKKFNRLERGEGNLKDLATFASLVKEIEQVADIDRNDRDRARRWSAEGSVLFHSLIDLPPSEVEDFLALRPPTPAAVAGLLLFALKESRSESGREKAKARSDKYLPARKLVLREWAKQGAERISKQSFAKVLSYRIEQELGIEVTSRTIERDWLPKGRIRV